MVLHKTIANVTTRLDQELRTLVGDVKKTGLSPERFRRLIPEFRELLNAAGREVLVATVAEFDEAAEITEFGGRTHRFKMPSEKKWLTPFGVVCLERRYFQPDAGGQGVVPLDVRCGMVDRYLTPDLEEQCALASAMLVPKEVERLFAKIFPQAPSAKAIQRVIVDAGRFAQQHAEQIEDAMEQQAPLSPDGEILAVSWDGKPVPLRERGIKTGRPPDRPGVRDGSETPTAWKEAGVGTISIYGGLNERGEPERLDTRYFARMPEPQMATLLQQQRRVVGRLRASMEFREVAVLCDGKPSIWKAAEKIEEYQGATFILDFYHAAQHLSKAAEAIYGKDSAFADRWFQTYRDRMQLEKDGTQAAIRSMRYHRGNLAPNTMRYKVLTGVIRFFSKHRSRMRYWSFITRGLPIGSGPVEAACKTVVGARLTRSGMRWSREGGQNVLNLRAHYLSNRWDVFWKAYQQRATG